MTATTAPHLRSTPTSKQLIVDGKPFFMRAAELQNSSLSSAEYMMTKWQKLLDMNINTILGSVTWEMIEPVEGQFDFTEIDQVITDARNFGMRLVLLWFGSFKNGQSSYVPSWVKLDTKRFPRVQLRKAGGVLETAEVLSLFDTEGAKADSKAFQTLMQHLKEVDGGNHTVIMVQVENETGVLGDSRDGSSAASQRFASPVPTDLLDFLVQDWESLHSDLRRNLPDLTSFQELSKLGKSWEDVFGRSPKTDELFMAYHLCQYVDTVAAAGRKAYDLPLFTNVWMNYVDDDSDNAFPTVAGGGGNPGDYPSGGPVSNVLDVWQHFAPHLDFIAPDVYLTDYQRSCAKYRHRGQPLFIPEQRRSEYGARRIWTAIANYQALGVSPFGIDTLEPEMCPFTRHYGLLKQVNKIVLDAQTRPGSSVGFYFDELDESQPSKPVQVQKAGFNITIDRCFVFGKPGPGAGMLIHLGGEGKTARFLLVGWGFHAAFKSANAKSHFTGILNFKEKRVVDEGTGELKTVRTLGGDETRSGIFAMMPNEDPDYGGFPICVTIPAATAIAEVEVYSLEE
ncbi:hypothetical protein B9Z65_6055 [Elsinoe australis]|uniref:Uncharacterized protein n=1 Tax=Elsinoe australis TaxID=40998 RepID=A0A2P7YRB0_9PEZI|nr:hypothetical protein B9Z65_6055 [Elsinoe australis]